MEFRGEGVKSDMGDWRGEQRFFQRVSQARNQLDKSALSAVLNVPATSKSCNYKPSPKNWGTALGLRWLLRCSALLGPVLTGAEL